MPAKSPEQQHLMAAALHGADFPMARKVRSTMSHEQMRAFAMTREHPKRAAMHHLLTNNRDR